jgi:hypothetical protein
MPPRTRPAGSATRWSTPDVSRIRVVTRLDSDSWLRSAACRRVGWLRGRAAEHQSGHSALPGPRRRARCQMPSICADLAGLVGRYLVEE